MERTIKSKSLDLYEDQINIVSKLTTKLESKRDKSVKGKSIKQASVWRLIVDKGIETLKSEM